jgi:hypothetical protein
MLVIMPGIVAQFGAFVMTIGVVPNSRVVPPNGGTHTAESTGRCEGADVLRTIGAGGYGSLLFAGTTSARCQADLARAPSIIATAFEMP